MSTTHTTNCHADTHGNVAPEGSPVVALVGAPNAGKSTLFNALTGARAQMGNWPGTTVEVSRGGWNTQYQTYDVIDFPGAYSLDPLSPDEALTRELVIDVPECHRPDLVIAVIDATALSRGLYMVAQLAEHNLRLVVAVTKADLASVDVEALSRGIGAPVVAIDARHRGHEALSQLSDATHTALTHPPHTRRETVGEEEESVDKRFEWIDALVSSAVQPTAPTTTEKIDRVALHPVAGPILFLAVMWLVFQITTTVAVPLQDGLDGFFSGPVSDVVSGWLEPWPIVQGFVVDGLIAGVGMVLTFAPLMALMFLCLAVLEDSGYMARAAVVADRAMKAVGLPGKAFIPLIVGFGCNVPAISATRVLAQPHQRLQTALLIPFASCSARLTVYVMLAATFFPEHAGTVVFAMYVISIVLMIAVGFLLRKTLWRAMGTDPLIIDLPRYQLPGPRLALSVMWVRLKGFLRTAGGIIVITVIVVFALQATPARGDAEFGDVAPADSVYGVVSDAISPVFAPAGFDSWSLTGPLITGFVAKEAVISSWAQTYSLTEDDEVGLSEAVRTDFARASDGHTLAAVWAYMLFLLAYTPCVATLAAQRREIGLRWTLFGIGMQLVVAWLLAVVVFNGLAMWL